MDRWMEVVWAGGLAKSPAGFFDDVVLRVMVPPNLEFHWSGFKLVGPARATGWWGGPVTAPGGFSAPVRVLCERDRVAERSLSCQVWAPEEKKML